MKTILILTTAVCLAACSKPAAEQATATTPAAATTTTAAPAPAGGDTFAIPANLQTTPSGLKYSIDQPGSGAQPKSGQTVSVHYTGWLTNGTKFDSSRGGDPLEFPIGQGRVVKGWDEGIGAMKVGEKRTLVIPPDLGYGAAGSDVIPPNATMVFKVELVGVR
jgi:peptidylprolyl isomerase